MSEPRPPDPSRGAEPLSYRSPEPPPVGGRAFGNIWGNIAMGVAAIICSIVLAGMLQTSLPVSVLPLATLALGLVAACFPRYRGVLFGMLLIIVGVPLLLLGICMVS